MIKNLSLILILLLSKFFTYGQNISKLTPLQMRQDIDTLIKFLEETHPNLYYRYSKEKFYKDAKSIKNNLVKNLNLIDFYLTVEPLMSKLEDGHTDISIPIKFYNNQNPFVLPYVFDLSPQEPYIVCCRPYHTINTKIPPGAKIVSINNIPAKKIVNDIINLNTGESRSFKAEYGANYFDFYMEVLYKANGNYKIKYNNSGIIKTVFIKGIKEKVIEQRLEHFSDTITDKEEAEINYSLELLDKNKVAFLNFKSFDWNNFTSFTDSAFTVIKQNGIKNLIINLMDDGGGDSDVGDAFFQYILNKPFRQYDKVLEKNSRLLKERLRQHLVNKKADSADYSLLARKNGSYDTVFYNYIPIQKNDLRFNGNIYLLINLQTYSSAADFAQCFKYNNRGLIIGEETGGLVESYGDIVTTYLPNTQLEVTISSKLYYDAGIKENEWHGVKPDITVSSKIALTKALEIINNNK